MSPAPNRARISRGRATNQIGARWYRDNGFPYAEAVTGAMTGRDITGMPACAPEMKATADMPGTPALLQARRNAHPDDLHWVVWRPNGYGEERVGDWPVLMTLAEHTRLVRLAGYGDPLPGACHCGCHRHPAPSDEYDGDAA